MQSRHRRTSSLFQQHRQFKNPSSTEGLTRTVDVIAKVGSPVAIITALLLYFGWVRSDVQANALGFDSSLLFHSPQEYVLRSITVLFLPLIALLIAGIALTVAHQRLLQEIAMRRHNGGAIAKIVQALRYAWIASALLGLALVVAIRRVGVAVFPIILTIGVVATIYGHTLRRELRKDRAQPHPILKILMGTLVGVLLFWSTERVAQQTGESLARHIADNVRQLHGVTVYSSRSLHISAPGVIETKLYDEKGLETYRYDGLRLLERSGGKYFLLYDGWSRNQGRVILLTDDAALRIELLPADVR